MALKDLVAHKSALVESKIELLVSDYVRYDLEAKEIHLTDAVGHLPARAKVLIGLVAHLGWRFLLEEDMPKGITPAQLQEILGVPGGTLRPTLKDLRDRHLIMSTDGLYFVRVSSLDAIRAELNAGQLSEHSKVNRKHKAVVSSRPKAPRAEKRRRKLGSAMSNGPKARFEGWMDNGFFKEGRTLASVHERFHQEGIIVPQSSIPAYLLGAVRQGRLSRRKQKVGGKAVWVYEAAE